WLALEKPQTTADSPVLRVAGEWQDVLAPARRHRLALALYKYASQRRWFRGKARDHKDVAISDVIHVDADRRFALVLLRVDYAHGPGEVYVMPLAFAEDAAASDSMRAPSLAIANIEIHDVQGRGTVTGILYDALSSDVFSGVLLRAALKDNIALDATLVPRL